jgi:hypothetical protein
MYLSCLLGFSSVDYFRILCTVNRNRMSRRYGLVALRVLVIIITSAISPAPRSASRNSRVSTRPVTTLSVRDASNVHQASASRPMTEEVSLAKLLCVTALHFYLFSPPTKASWILEAMHPVSCSMRDDPKQKVTCEVCIIQLSVRSGDLSLSRQASVAKGRESAPEEQMIDMMKGWSPPRACTHR